MESSLRIDGYIHFLKTTQSRSEAPNLLEHLDALDCFTVLIFGDLVRSCHDLPSEEATISPALITRRSFRITLSHTAVEFTTERSSTNCFSTWNNNFAHIGDMLKFES
jgi:hypothetical protein